MAESDLCGQCGSQLTSAGICPNCLLGNFELPESESYHQTEVFGHYDLLSTLGSGGMGTVYLAHDRTLDREVALKILPGGHLAGENALERFHREARAASQLDHPGIVPIYEVGEIDGTAYYTMRIMDRDTLGGWAINEKPPPRDAVEILLPALDGLDFAHKHGILHRDIKPSNILLDRNTGSALTDFGLARRLEKEASLTVSGDIVGSPAFLAPEVLTGRQKASVASDVYGVGAVLYHVLTRVPPFQASTVGALINKVSREAPVRPRVLNSDVERDLEAVCLKCLEANPEDRYPSVEVLTDDLRAWLADKPVSARRPGATLRVWKWARRKPNLATATALGLALLAMVSAGSVYFAIESREARRQMREAQLETARSLMREGVDLCQSRRELEGLAMLVSAHKLCDEHPETAEMIEAHLTAWSPYIGIRMPGTRNGMEPVPDWPGALVSRSSYGEPPWIWDLGNHKKMALSSVPPSIDRNYLVKAGKMTQLTASGDQVGYTITRHSASQKPVHYTVPKQYRPASQEVVLLQEGLVFTGHDGLQIYDITGEEGVVRIIDAEEKSPPAVVADFEDKSYIITRAGNLHCLQRPDMEVRWSKPLGSRGFRHAEVDPTGRFLACASNGLPPGVILSTENGELVYKFPCSYSAEEIEFSPDGRWAALASRDDVAEVTALVGGQWMDFGYFDDSATPMLAVAFSPDSRYLAYGGEEGRIFIRELGGEDSVSPGWGDLSAGGHRLSVPPLFANGKILSLDFMTVNDSVWLVASTPEEGRAWKLDYMPETLWTSPEGEIANIRKTELGRRILTKGKRKNGRHSIAFWDPGKPEALLAEALPHRLTSSVISTSGQWFGYAWLDEEFLPNRKSRLYFLADGKWQSRVFPASVLNPTEWNGRPIYRTRGDEGFQLFSVDIQTGRRIPLDPGCPFDPAPSKLMESGDLRLTRVYGKRDEPWLVQSLRNDGPNLRFILRKDTSIGRTSESTPRTYESITQSKDGKWAVSTARRYIQFWDPANAKQIGPEIYSEKRIHQCQMYPDRPILALSYLSTNVRFIHLPSRLPLGPTLPSEKVVSAMSFTEDGAFQYCEGRNLNRWNDMPYVDSDRFSLEDISRKIGYRWNRESARLELHRTTEGG